jgi:hypothetical protein
MSGEPTKGEPRKECLIATLPRNGRHADIGGLGLARARAVAEFSKGVAVVCMFKLPVLHKQQTT